MKTTAPTAIPAFPSRSPTPAATPFRSLYLTLPKLFAAAICALVLSCLNSPAALAPGTLPVGVAQTDITPDYPVRLSGFGGRRAESEGVTQKIWAKALAFGDAQLGPAVLITTDNLGVPDEITQEVARRLSRKAGLKIERLAITASHTHTAPMLKNVAPTLFGMPIPPEHQAHIDRYTREFTDKLEQAALAALAELRPSRLAWGIGSVGFAMNRRTAGGPVDHDLPVLVVRDLDGNTRAVYFSYACHCVTLSHNQISGDWAGYAMEQVEKRYPGCIALSSVGCGADSNPSSGVTGAKVEVADDQGRQIADEVARLLGTPLQPITRRPAASLKRIPLPFDTPRTRAEWEARAKQNDAVGYHARVNLARLDQGQPLLTQIDYPVQTWAFGDQMAMVFLPGEVVVDYSLRLKRELDRNRVWINAYANDAPCYIPSERVLKEGGYEGESAMIYYDKPQKFAPGLEQKIINAVRSQIPDAFLAPEGTEGTAPRSPDQALHTLQTHPGLHIELVASEPLVNSPVAIDWDAAGQLWVCEMFDYPTGLDQNWLPGGRVKRLRDTDGDGTCDEATVFLEGIPFPTGVTAYGRGLFVSAAPDILYAEDTDNDGRADHVEKLFTGFAAENYQARVNSLSLGLDNWIYGANGLLGGSITGQGGTTDIRGHDFRFRFRNGPMETVNGLTQQGRVRDDWGRWFGCNNGNALDYFPNEARYLSRNPHVPAPPSAISPAGDFDVGRVFPASRTLERFNDPEAANRITSGCGLGLYRDTLLGPEFYNNTFTCEPVHNLVHRLKLEADGLTLKRQRAADETASEFLASTDNWFRPVQVRTGPDGALYVVDMYRFLIEHPRWIPAARLAKIDVRAGATMGRIYRVRPEAQPLRPIRDLTRLNAADLGRALQSPNGTERDRVHIELLVRQDPKTAPPLRELARNDASPQVRLQSLCALDALNALTPALLAAALDDNHEQVRLQAIRLSERWLRPGAAPSEPAGNLAPLYSKLLALTNDTAMLVARQLAFTLGEWDDPPAGQALANLARRWLDQADVRAAVLSSARRHAAPILAAIIPLSRDRSEAAAWLDPLVATAAAAEDDRVFQAALLALLPSDQSLTGPAQLSSLAHLLNALERNDTTPHAYFQAHPEVAAAEPRFNQLIASAAQTAADPNAEVLNRAAAVQLVARASTSDANLDLLTGFLTHPTPDPLREAATAALRRQQTDAIPRRLLAAWPHTSPASRREIINLLLSRDSWTLGLLDAIRNATVRPGEIALTDRQRLRQSSNPELARLALELLPAQPASARGEVLAAYQAALALTGNAENGREVFAKNCMSCHALGDLGHPVGPDLAALRTKEPDYWLKNILDPNAVVEPRYVAYEIETQDDRALSGIIQNETVNSLTIASGSGVVETVPRTEIKSIRASSLSLMPEGLEQGMTPQNLADLLAFVTPRTPPKSFPGNAPALIQPGPNHVLMLPAAQAEIYGGAIAFEGQFNNIGMWHGADDYAAWNARIDQAGPYEVYLDYACADGSAGNTYQLGIAGQSLTGQIDGTGPNWSRYVQTRVGSIQLEPGRHRLTFKPDSALRGALLDLRGIALAPPGQTPDWPVPASTPTVTADTLLRDPVSIARYIIDPSQPTDAREALIRANPQFAAEFVAEMVRDLNSSASAESERIPWIWRVAIACAKRDEPVQIERLLRVSLPEPDEPLRDWQAVVIGGGIINGLTQRNHWPAEYLKPILAADEDLLQRWHRALDLASAMADDSAVPSGTRYDALRMLGLEPWEKRGAQLARYLNQETNAELQMGAVSALGDLASPHATTALLSHLRQLKGTNRNLALEALLRNDSRIAALLDYAKQHEWTAETLGEERVSRLATHSNPAIRDRTKGLFP